MDEIWDLYDEKRNLTSLTLKRKDFPEKKEQIKSSKLFHLVVHVWIKNKKGQWLISKRTANKHFPLLWEPTGGSALSGEDSISAAIREVKEELGIELQEEKGRLFKVIKREIYADFCDVWIFEHECELSDIVLQKEETCDAMWATAGQIRELIDKNQFVPLDNMQYVNELISE